MRTGIYMVQSSPCGTRGYVSTHTGAIDIQVSDKGVSNFTVLCKNYFIDWIAAFEEQYHQTFVKGMAHMHFVDVSDIDVVHEQWHSQTWAQASVSGKQLNIVLS